MISRDPIQCAVCWWHVAINIYVILMDGGYLLLEPQHTRTQAKKKKKIKRLFYFLLMQLNSF